MIVYPRNRPNLCSPHDKSVIKRTIGELLNFKWIAVVVGPKQNINTKIQNTESEMKRQGKYKRP